MVSDGGFVIDLEEMEVKLPKDISKTVDIFQMSKLAQIYKRMCTAEFILENYKDFFISDERVAYDLAIAARDIMEEQYVSETEAVNLALDEYEHSDDER